MDCGVKAIEYLLKLRKQEHADLIHSLQQHMQERGLSIFKIIEICKSYGISVKAYKSKKIYPTTPYIAYLRGFKYGHYVVIEKVSKWQVEIYDAKYKSFKICKLLLYLIWGRKILIMK